MVPFKGGDCGICWTLSSLKTLEDRDVSVNGSKVTQAPHLKFVNMLIFGLIVFMPTLLRLY